MTRPMTLLPLAAVVVLVVTWSTHATGPLVVTVVGAFLVAAVLAAVEHAEVVGHRVGDPIGSLILAVAVTVIEVALIVTLTISEPAHASTLARDTVFAAVMLTLNGIVGFSLLVGAMRHHLAVFNAEGTGSALATVLTLVSLALVLPRFTTSRDEPVFTPLQLGFAAVVSLALYGSFVFTQTVRHREFFVPPRESTARADTDHEVPGRGQTWLSLVLLVIALVDVVGLAKLESKPLEKAVTSAGLSQELVGVVIAAVVLLPEGISAVRAAADDRVQVSFNLAYGSAMATMGLTIPAIAVTKIWLTTPLELGLRSTQIVMLIVTALIAVLTVVPGRSKPLQGILHLVLLATFVFLSVSP